MKIWLLTGIIALIVVVAVSALFMTKGFAKAETPTGDVVSSGTGCGCGENCACGCKGQCTKGSDCGCLKEGGSGCAAKTGGSCGCSKQ